ncbi:putative RNA-binding protein 15B [Dunckerocampus dactyliophorus]|uniref:putative RNA-binding protein 15B n=1 Tax=Dunckerocampus dactyliophorus TaxID=161453 RepID=UPI0024059062|nr:putative RNA-binding protein 15B [Dunckerocampus dactyliophorus]
MKRQAARESPARAAARRLRERDRESGRREELPPPPPLALLLADSRGHRRRSRSRERDKPLHPRHDVSVLGRTTPARDYKTLLISNLGQQVPDEDVEDALFHEFKKFGDVSVKLSHTPELGRIAYVNFRHPEDAKEARHAKSSRLVLGERQLKIEPVYVRRRSVTPPDVTYLAYRQRSLSPPGPTLSLRELRARHYALESLSRERLLDYYGMLDERGRPYGFPPAPLLDDLKPEDDQRATSNLFIGNLDGGVTEAELRRGFDKYGVIEDVVIKRPARGQGGAYAFVKFQNLDMAHRAKVAMQGRLICGNPIKIGYGKANPTTRLWVGGLGPANSLAALAREFDRFGSIRNIDYVKGDTFAYIQYESLDAAQAACTQMRGFPLGGPERRLRVDFAKVEESPARPFPPSYQQPVQLLPPYDLLGEAYGRHRSLERELRGGARVSPPSHSLPSQRERERTLLERDFAASPPRGPDRRVGGVEAFGRSARGGRSRSRSRERWLKEREERRGRRRSHSLSAEREKGRARARTSPDASPDRARVRAPDSTTEPRDHSPDGGVGRSAPKESESPPTRHHSKRASAEQVDNHHAPTTLSPPLPTNAPSSCPGSLSEFARSTLSKSWRGFFALKNSSFPTELFLLEGGASFFAGVMRHNREQLKIAQRLRMDQSRLDEVSRRVKLGRPDGFAVLLALQGPVDRQAPAPEAGLQVRLLRHLVAYLRNKEAAGVVSLPPAKEGGPSAMLYAFPPGDFSVQFLQAAKRAATRLDEEHMVVVIVNDTN